VIEWEQGLKHWGRERIIESSLGASKLGKGSSLNVYFHLILYWMMIDMNG